MLPWGFTIFGWHVIIFGPVYAALILYFYSFLIEK